MKIKELNTYSNLELALMVLLGYLGTGKARKEKLGNRYTSVQGLVNSILTTDTIPIGRGRDMDEAKLRAVLLEMAPTSADYDEFIKDFIKFYGGHK